MPLIAHSRAMAVREFRLCGDTTWRAGDQRCAERPMRSRTRAADGSHGLGPSDFGVFFKLAYARARCSEVLWSVQH